MGRRQPRRYRRRNAAVEVASRPAARPARRGSTELHSSVYGCSTDADGSGAACRCGIISGHAASDEQTEAGAYECEWNSPLFVQSQRISERLSIPTRWEASVSTDGISL